MYSSKDAFRISRLSLRIGDVRSQERGLSAKAREQAAEDASLLVVSLNAGTPESEVFELIARLERRYGIELNGSIAKR